MSGNDDKSQAAAERIKAQALSAAKGLSRTQAERAAAAAARNVNAYGQKEEGPSRWQERKEAKRQMYLMSTEKAVILGVKPKAAPASSGGAYTQCQKCFQPGHWTYECKNERVYISRPSRTQQLKNPKLKKMAAPVSYQFQNPDLEKEKEEERKLIKEKMKQEKSEKSKRKSKRKYRSRSDSDSSEASVFDSHSESSVTDSEHSSGSSSSYSSSSDSEDKKRRPKRKQQKRRHRRETSSSASSESDSESASDSDSDDKGSRKKSRKRSDRR
ncbi:zinc finger CCHC domain-containing protein 10-like [Oryza brachyantha]|uniref:CCHC-type domain-containing protein n=1 Tax=Oryza brachyantha TaxID=4533 RepID=J3N6N5_ORYBR|nr:zinc finger CCHC domain-containing protein 10-like [Oryza brachyantha]